MSYRGWCYTRPRADAATPPKYSGARARLILGPLYNELIYDVNASERSVVALVSDEVVELLRFHYRDDEHGRAMQGCLLLLFDATTAVDEREEVMKRARERVFSQHQDPEDHPNLRVYESESFSAAPHRPLDLAELSTDLSVLSRINITLVSFKRLARRLGIKPHILIYSLYLLSLSAFIIIGISFSRETSEPAPTLNLSARALNIEAQSVAGGASDSNSDVRARERTQLVDSAQSMRPLIVSSSQVNFQVSSVRSLSDCISAYHIDSKTRDRWSSWIRASLTRRCQQLTRRSALSLYAELTAVGELQNLESSRALLTRCLNTDKYAHEIARYQPLEMTEVDQLKARCDSLKDLSSRPSVSDPTTPPRSSLPDSP